MGLPGRGRHRRQKSRREEPGEAVPSRRLARSGPPAEPDDLLAVRL